MLLFSSYLFVTAGTMFFAGFISTRIGIKATLVTGLVIIVLFASLAGLSDTIGQIIGLRAGWGFGNALFVTMALAESWVRRTVVLRPRSSCTKQPWVLVWHLARSWEARWVRFRGEIRVCGPA